MPATDGTTKPRPRPPYRRVAVVGAGPGGLTAARALLAENAFDVIDVYEQRGRAGGTWNHTPETIPCPVPSTDPKEDMREDVSAIYDDLETNIPHPLMQFPEHPFPAGLPLFPRHEAVLDYLLDYAKPVNHLIRYNTRVTNISRTADGKAWELTSTPHSSSSAATSTSSSSPPSSPPKTETKTYDALLLSTGHYSHPFIPSLPGLSTFPVSKISHSHSFRSPTPYHQKRVLVIGNSASGYDIALHLSPHVRFPLLQSIRTPSPISSPTHIKPLPALTGLRGPGTAIFSDGTEEHDIDHVIFCTGYLYTFPFLSPPKERDTILAEHGKRLKGLYQHVLAIHDPSIAVIGVPIKIVPFPLSHNQAGWVARVWSGRVALQSTREMEDWEKEELERKGETRFEFFGFPEDAGYLDDLADLAEGNVGWKADSGGSDRNRAKGKWKPVRWTPKDRWVRSLTAEIKRRYVKKKQEGVVAMELEELGLRWDAEKGVGVDMWSTEDGEKERRPEERGDDDEKDRYL